MKTLFNLIIIALSVNGVLEMRYTDMKIEEYRGAEMVCDMCNRLYDGGTWFYARYDSSTYPYAFYCPECVERIQ
jgi:hypothetical protein